MYLTDRKRSGWYNTARPSCKRYTLQDYQKEKQHAINLPHVKQHFTIKRRARTTHKYIKQHRQRCEGTTNVSMKLQWTAEPQYRYIHSFIYINCNKTKKAYNFMILNTDKTKTQIVIVSSQNKNTLCIFMLLYIIYIKPDDGL